MKLKYKVLAIDFDGTITLDQDPDSQQKQLIMRFGAVEAIRLFHKLGATLILWTCRTDQYLQQALDFLESYGIRHCFQYVNEHVPDIIEQYCKTCSESRKIWADKYIDDRNLGVKEINWFDIIKEVIEMEG